MDVLGPLDPAVSPTSCWAGGGWGDGARNPQPSMCGELRGARRLPAWAFPLWRKLEAAISLALQRGCRWVLPRFASQRCREIHPSSPCFIASLRHQLPPLLHFPTGMCLQNSQIQPRSLLSRMLFVMIANDFIWIVKKTPGCAPPSSTCGQTVPRGQKSLLYLQQHIETLAWPTDCLKPACDGQDAFQVSHG